MPTSQTPHVSTPSTHPTALDVKELGSETLIPPIASIQVNQYLHNAIISNTLIQDNDHLTHALSPNALTLVNGRSSHALSPDTSTTNPFVRHETPLSMDENPNISIELCSLSCDDVCPLKIGNLANDNWRYISANVYGTTSYSVSTSMSIAFMPEPGQETGAMQPLLTTDSNELSNSCAPLVDYVLEHPTLHTTPELNATSTNSKGERDHNIDFTNTLNEILKYAGLLDNSPDPASPALEPVGSNKPCDVYFIHQSSAEEPLSYSKSVKSILSNVYSDVPLHSKPSLHDSDEHFPTLTLLCPFAPLSPKSKSIFKGL